MKAKEKIDIDERIRYVLEEKDSLFVSDLTERWGVSASSVRLFLKNHGLPKLPSTRKFLAQELKRKEKIDYILMNQETLTVSDVAKHWGDKPSTVKSFIERNKLPRIPAGSSRVIWDGNRKRKVCIKYGRMSEEEVLYERIRYVRENKEKLTIRTLSLRWNVSTNYVSNFLRRYKLPKLEY